MTYYLKRGVEIPPDLITKMNLVVCRHADSECEAIVIKNIDEFEVPEASDSRFFIIQTEKFFGEILLSPFPPQVMEKLEKKLEETP